MYIIADEAFLIIEELEKDLNNSIKKIKYNDITFENLSYQKSYLYDILNKIMDNYSNDPVDIVYLYMLELIREKSYTKSKKRSLIINSGIKVTQTILHLFEERRKENG